jgi:predicted nucleic acid-binding Zn ribbon protein
MKLVHCIVCGIETPQPSYPKKYCSHRCKRRDPYHRAMATERHRRFMVRTYIPAALRPRIISCKTCGLEFSVVGNPSQQYCSRSCKHVAYKRRQREERPWLRESRKSARRLRLKWMKLNDPDQVMAINARKNEYSKLKYRCDPETRSSVRRRSHKHQTEGRLALVALYELGAVSSISFNSSRERQQAQRAARQAIIELGVNLKEIANAAS